MSFAITISATGVEIDEDAHFDDWNFPPGEDVEGVFRIVYVDGGCSRSERTIDQCRFIQLRDVGYILAHCRLRDGERLFRLDRIAEVSDPDSGEVLANLAGHAIGGRSAIERRDAHERMREVMGDLDALVFVATLSAGMRDSQVALIVDYLVLHGGIVRSAALESRVKKHKAPNPVNFRIALKNVSPARAAALRAAAGAVLDKTRRSGDLDRGVLGALDRFLGLDRAAAPG